MRAGLALVGLALARGAAAAQSPAPPEDVRATLEEVLETGPYYLDSASHIRWNPLWWASAIWDWINDRLAQLSGLLGGAPMWVTWMIVIALSVILLALIAHVLYSIFAMGRREAEAFEFTVTRETTDPSLIAEEAQRLAAEGAHADAVRRLYMAALVMLENKRGGQLRPGLTNREYLRTFRLPWVLNNLRVFVDLLEGKWYRGADFEARDFDRCREAYDALSEGLEDAFEERAS